MADDKKQEIAGPRQGAEDLTIKEVKMWFRRIRSAQRAMRDRYDRWDDRINLLKADEGGEDVPEVNVNLIPSTLAIVLNNLWTRDREVFGSTDNEEIREKILPALQNRLRRLLKKLRPYRQFRRAIRDALIFGNGFVEVGYSTEHFGGGDERSDGRVIETNTRVLRGLPYVLRVSPRGVYVDPQATDLDDARWVITVERRPKSEIENNSNYQNVSEVKSENEEGLDAIFKDRDRRVMLEGGEEDKEEALVTLYKVQDKASRATFVLAEGLKEKTVIPPVYDAMPFSGFSLEMFGFNEIPDEFWSLSEIGQWEDHQRHLSEFRSAMIDDAQRFALIWLVRRGALSAEELQKLVEAKSRSYIEVEDTTAVSSLPTPPMPREFSMMEAIIQNDIRQVSGISDFERGGETSAQTATEVTARQQASAGRGQPMRDDVTEVISRVVDKIGVILTTLMMQDGEEPIEEGEIEWQMDAPSAQAFSPAVRKKTWNDVLVNVMQIEAAKPGTINLLEVIKRWFSAMDIQDVEKLVFEAVSPGSGLAPDQENLLLMAGLPVEPSRDEQFQAHIQAHAALMDMPEVRQGLVNTQVLEGHIEATMQLAQASGVMLDVGQLGSTGSMGLEQLQRAPVTDASVASAAERK